MRPTAAQALHSPTCLDLLFEPRAEIVNNRWILSALPQTRSGLTIFAACDQPNGEDTIVPCGFTDTVAAGVSASRADTPDMANSYDTYLSSGLYDRRYPGPNRRTLRRLLRLMPMDGRFVDFGAGTGRYTLPLMQRTRATGVAFDVCPTACRMLAERLAVFVGKGRLSVCNGESTALVETFRHGFDLALLAFGVLSHVAGRKERADLLAGIREMLKSDGVLVLSLPNARRRFHAEQRAAAQMVRDGALEPGDVLYARRSDAGNIQMFYHLFSPTEACHELSSAGFRIESIEPESLLPETAVVGHPLLGRLDDLACAVAPAATGYGFLIVARP